MNYHEWQLSIENRLSTIESHTKFIAESVKKLIDELPQCDKKKHLSMIKFNRILIVLMLSALIGASFVK